MDMTVMHPAQEHQVVKACVAAIGPVPYVMRVGPLRGPVTAGMAAATIASDKRAPDRGWNGATTPPDAQRFALRRAFDLGHRRVARNAAHRLRR